MKELSIEEKAKRYDEAIKVASTAHKVSSNTTEIRVYEELFPELEESEDEKMKKIISDILLVDNDEIRKILESNDVLIQDVWAWLEKQGEKTEAIDGFNTEFERQISHIIASTINKEYEYTEDAVKRVSSALLNYAKHEFEKQDEQKSFDYENVKPQSSSHMSYGKELEKRMNEACHRFFAPNTDNNRYSASDLFYAGVKAERDLNISAWSEEDEIALGDALWCCKQAASIAKDENDMGNIWYAERWLKLLKERIQPQQEWSEEDSAMLDNIVAWFEGKWGTLGGKVGGKEAYISFLKSIRDRYTWKPNKAQIEAIEDAIEFLGCTKKVRDELKSLHEQLKKLKG